jgi:hypothetical protein
VFHRQHPAVARGRLAARRERDLVGRRPAHELDQLSLALWLDNCIRHGIADQWLDEARHGGDVMAVEFALSLAEGDATTVLRLQVAPLTHS